MKRLLLICILISLTVLGYTREEPAVLLGKTYQEVQNCFKPFDNYYLTEVTDSSLVFHNWKEDLTKSYFFKRHRGVRYCVRCEYKLDCLSGEELIGQHLFNEEWIPLGDNKWEFDTLAYDIPLTVKMNYLGEYMVFSYRYIPKK